MNTSRRRKLKDGTPRASGEENIPKVIQELLKKHGGKLEPQPRSQPLCERVSPRQPPVDYAAEMEKVKAETMKEYRQKCDEQIELARSGRQHEAALNLDLLMTEVRNTLWDDFVLSTSLRKIIEHAQHQVRAMAGPARTAKPASADEPIRVTADGRCIYRGKKLAVKLTPDEARWVERCIEIHHADGTEDFDQKEISLRVFGKATVRFAPSKIFRTSGQDVFFMLFEKTDTPGIITKKTGVVFEKPENG